MGTKIWSWIGKVAIIVGCLWGLIQLYNYFLPSQAHLDVFADYAKFEAPDNFRNEMYNGIHSFWLFDVENKDTKQISDIKLELPSMEGFYRIKSGESVAVAAFKETIPVGSLRPTQKINITVWGKEISLGWFNRDEMRLTHPNGVVPVVFPEKVTGFKAWIVRVFPYPAIIIILCVISIAVTTFLIFDLYNQTNKFKTLKLGLPKTKEDSEIMRQDGDNQKYS